MAIDTTPRVKIKPWFYEYMKKRKIVSWTQLVKQMHKKGYIASNWPKHLRRLFCTDGGNSSTSIHLFSFMACCDVLQADPSEIFHKLMCDLGYFKLERKKMNPMKKRAIEYRGAMKSLKDQSDTLYVMLLKEMPTDKMKKYVSEQLWVVTEKIPDKFTRNELIAADWDQAVDACSEMAAFLLRNKLFMGEASFDKSAKMITNLVTSIRNCQRLKDQAEGLKP